MRRTAEGLIRAWLLTVNGSNETSRIEFELFMLLEKIFSRGGEPLLWFEEFLLAADPQYF